MNNIINLDYMNWVWPCVFEVCVFVGVIANNYISDENYMRKLKFLMCMMNPSEKV